MTYDHHEIARAPCSARSAFSACWPAMDCAATVPTNSARKNSDRPLSRANRFTAELVSSLCQANQDAGAAPRDDDHEIGEEHSAHAGVSYPCLTSDKRAADAGVARRGRSQSLLLRRREGSTALLSTRVGFAKPSALSDVCGGSVVGYDASVSEMSG